MVDYERGTPIERWGVKTEVNEKKFHAEVIIPAEADKKANEMKSVGQAAYLKEQGLAMANAVNMPILKSF